jgi:hypothetical protein
MLDECYRLVSPLIANQRPQARHAAREACLFGRGIDRGYVLVGAWGSLGDAAPPARAMAANARRNSLSSSRVDI